MSEDTKQVEVTCRSTFNPFLELFRAWFLTQLMLVGLKLADQVPWSWLWVLSPTLAPIGSMCCVFVVMLVVTMRSSRGKRIEL